MSKYNENKEKYFYLPMHHSGLFFQYYWGKHLNFKLKLFGTPICILNFLCLALMFFHLCFYSTINRDQIITMVVLSVLSVLFASIFLINIFKGKTFVKDLKRTIFIIFNNFYNILLIIILVIVSESWTDNPSNVLIILFYVLAFIDYIFISINILIVLASTIILRRYSIEVNGNFLMNKYNKLDLEFFEYINEESDVWNKDEIIFQDANFILRYYGVGVFRKKYYLDCIYIFKLNDKYVFVNFCSFDNILVSKINKQELEQKLIFDLLRN